MRLNLWHHHLEHCDCSRRSILGAAAKVGTVGLLTGLSGLATAAEPSAQSVRSAAGSRAGGGNNISNQFDDVWFDYADPANLAQWVPGPYGPDDQRGSFNEVTPEKTAEAISRTLRPIRATKTYNLGELMYNGFPAFVTTPKRGYQQRATVTGYTPPADYEGYVTGLDPLAANRLSVHEERFPAVVDATTNDAPAGLTYQIGTQLDNLNHIGAGPYFYNGFLGPEILETYGTSRLGAENMGPIVTRGVLLDILGLKIAKRETSALGAPAANGQPVLLDNYRITIRDIQEAMVFGRIRSLEPGDAILFRTGWNQLLYSRGPEFARWGAAVGMPGIWLSEARYLASFRPALIGGDTWALEVLGRPDVTGSTAFAVHQELLMRFGIRIAESVVLDALARDKVYEFVYMVSPQFAEGATAGNTPPVALAQPGR